MAMLGQLSYPVSTRSTSMHEIQTHTQGGCKHRRQPDCSSWSFLGDVLVRHRKDKEEKGVFPADGSWEQHGIGHT